MKDEDYFSGVTGSALMVVQYYVLVDNTRDHVSFESNLYLHTQRKEIIAKSGDDLRHKTRPSS
jgi:hypothetical protein